MMDICGLSAVQILSNIKTRKFSVQEVASAYIKQIQEVNPYLNGLLQFNHERILEEAKAKDNDICNGNKLGKLHGLPITLKDAFHVSGFYISKGFSGYLKESELDATVVARLKAEGVIILGITNVPELLLAFETENPIYGRTNNPHDLNRTPGGSSGGEAAIIASGCSPLGIGTDAGGSIRIPAHYSGICAHKPTKGLVPFTGNIPFDGATGFTTSRVTMGPMARYIEDLSLILSVISGADHKDPYAPPVNQTEMKKSIDFKKLRIGYFFNISHINPCNDTCKTIQQTIETIKPLVNSIEEINPKFADDIYRLQWETLTIGGDEGKRIQTIYEQYGIKHPSPLIKQFLKNAAGKIFSLNELHRRFVEIEKFRFEAHQLLQKYDLIISPVAATAAKKHGETSDAIEDYTYSFIQSLSGLPSTILTCGKTIDNLPIAVQITAAPWKDYLCLTAAKKLQDIFGIPNIPMIEK